VEGKEKQELDIAARNTYKLETMDMTVYLVVQIMYTSYENAICTINLRTSQRSSFKLLVVKTHDFS
jgi:hypothetical protein